MKILIPVDGSKYSRTAVDLVASRSTLVGANPEVEVLNVQMAIPSRATRVVGKDVVSSYYTDALAMEPLEERAAGGAELRYILALNARPQHVAALADVVQRALAD